MDHFKNTLKAWELSGIIVIFFIGSWFHFIFYQLHAWRPIALIGAVNESVWEHLKIAFWPALFYAVLEYPFLRDKTKNFFFAKAVGFLITPVTISVVFYLYTAILGQHYLVADISLFLFAIAAGQTASLKILKMEYLGNKKKKAGIIIICILIAAFSLFTFFPPHLPLFHEVKTGIYGIPEKTFD